MNENNLTFKEMTTDFASKYAFALADSDSDSDNDEANQFLQKAKVVKKEA